MSEKKLCYERSKIIAALRDLNMIVVSLDRIGSCAEDLEEDEYHRVTSEFIDDWEVCRKLANLRMILSEPFSTELGPDNMDELEREMQDVQYWSWNQRKPKKLTR